MLPKQHPDALLYNKDPDGFVTRLYLQIKAEYASLYADAAPDLEPAWLFLREALQQGQTSKFLINRARYVFEHTDEHYRPACARFIRDRYWIKKFETVIPVHPVKIAGPYEGPMPEHP